MAKAKKENAKILKSSPPPKPEWWAKGVRFECQGSGKCCVSRGQYGFVYMNLTDRKRMAKVVGLSPREFSKKHLSQTDGVWHLKEDTPNGDCRFLQGGNRCGVYEGRPEQCRTWPFWPEVMNAKTWKKEVAAYCPGIGKGKLHSAEEIAEVMERQSQSEIDLINGR
ncbi:MAG: YkgJ family cysteine cluster protein [Bdellovibrionota bacterium]